MHWHFGRFRLDRARLALGGRAARDITAENLCAPGIGGLRMNGTVIERFP
jgi:hypothetical protein